MGMPDWEGCEEVKADPAQGGEEKAGDTHPLRGPPHIAPGGSAHIEETAHISVN